MVNPVSSEESGGIPAMRSFRSYWSVGLSVTPAPITATQGSALVGSVAMTQICASPFFRAQFVKTGACFGRVPLLSSWLRR